MSSIKLNLTNVRIILEWDNTMAGYFHNKKIDKEITFL